LLINKLKMNNIMRKTITQMLALFAALLLNVGYANAQTILFQETFNKMTTENTTKNGLTSGNTDESDYVVGGGGSGMLCSIDGTMNLTAGRFATKNLDLTGEVTLYVTYKFTTTAGKRFQIDLDKTGTSGMGGIFVETDTDGPTTFTTKEFPITAGTEASYIHFRSETEGTVVIDEIKLVRTAAAVGQSDDATLKSLTVNGATVVLVAEQLNYTVNLPAGTTAVPTVEAQATSSKATVVITPAASLSAQTSIEVTAEDGTKATYLIGFNVLSAPSADAKVIYDAATYAVEQSGTEVTGAITTVSSTNATLTVNGSDAQFTNVTGGEEATITLPNNLSFSYTNSASAKKFVKFTKDGYIRPEGKDLILKISGLSAGDKINITDVKGSGGADYVATGIAEGETVTIAADAISVFTATGSEMTIKTGGGKYYISKITVDGTTSISKVAAAKAVKSVAYYDILGRRATAATKGLVIAKTTYTDGTSSSNKVYNLDK
jgi:hypothetical protein